MPKTKAADSLFQQLYLDFNLSFSSSICCLRKASNYFMNQFKANTGMPVFTSMIKLTNMWCLALHCLKDDNTLQV